MLPRLACAVLVGLALVSSCEAALIRLQWEKVFFPTTGSTGYLVDSCVTDWRTTPCQMQAETAQLLPRGTTRYYSPSALSPDMTKCWRVRSVVQGVSSKPSYWLCVPPD